MHKIYFLLVLLVAVSLESQCVAQIKYTSSIDLLIKDMGIIENLPKDQYHNLYPPKAEDSPRFTLILRSNNQEYEIRSVFDPMKILTNFGQHVQLEFQRYISMIAANDTDNLIEVTGFTNSQKKRMNIDWGMKADFTPKKEFSSFSKARLYYLYKESRGTIVCVVLYNSTDIITSDSFFYFDK